MPCLNNPDSSLGGIYLFTPDSDNSTLAPSLNYCLLLVTFLTKLYNLTINNNYWTSLSKMLWFVSGEPKPKAEANIYWAARHWQITIFCDNWVQELFYHLITKLVFLWIYSGSEAICHFHTSKIKRRMKAWFCLCISRILFAAKHSWTTLRMSRPLFVGSYLQVMWWAFGPLKGRTICIEWSYNFLLVPFSPSALI